MKKSERSFLLITCLVLILLLFLLVSSTDSSTNYKREWLTLEIQSGETASQVCNDFEQIGLITSATDMLNLLKEEDLTKQIKAGTYQLEKGNSLKEYISIITTAPLSNFIEIKIYPGWTIADIDEKLSQRNYFKAGEYIRQTEIIKAEKGLSFTEGWFESGTYTVLRTDAAKELAQKMYAASIITLNSYTLIDFSDDQIIIIATLIEAETKNVDQMAMISGIIRNRLKADMPLGIDATTRYEKKDWKNPLQASDFNSNSSYNTRRNKGLCETGICCPSSQAIIAAIVYKENSYFYYRHDEAGNIYYSKTYEEHLNAIN